MEKKDNLDIKLNETYDTILINQNSQNIGNLAEINTNGYSCDGKTYSYNDIENNKDLENDKFYYEIICKESHSKSFLEGLVEEIHIYYRKNKWTLTKCFQHIAANFNKTKFKADLEKKIIGDIGEILFILKMYHLGYKDFQNNLHLNDYNLYDFVVDGQNYHFEIKSSSTIKNEIILSEEQLDQLENRKIIVVKFKIIEKNDDDKSLFNILDLYQMLEDKTGKLNELLEQKQNEYKNLEDDISKDTIDFSISSLSVNLEKISYGIYNESSLPSIQIVLRGSLKNLKIYLDATDGNLEPIEEIEKYL